MSDEERSASEHRSVLKGMTRDEAKALVADARTMLWDGKPDAQAMTVFGAAEVLRLLALAALGAEVVGAKDRREERFWCHECGNGVSVGEDGGCGSCGRDTEIRVCRVLVMEGE